MSTSPYRPDIPVINDRGNETCFIRPRTIDEMADAMQWAKENDGKAKGEFSSCQKGRKNNWHGTETIDEYQDMLRNGWDAGVEGVEGLEGLRTDRAERLTFNRNVGGVFPIVPAAIAGAPDAMLEVRPRPVDSVRGLTLVVDGSMNAYVTSDTALEYSRKVMKMVAWLQAEQIDVSVYVVMAIQMSGKRVVYLTCIRNTGDVFQPERIAACVHPSWLRRAWFAMCEREYYEFGMPECSVCKNGYGVAMHVTADELRKALSEAYSVIMLPKVGDGDPERTIKDALNVKLREGEV